MTAHTQSFLQCACGLRLFNNQAEASAAKPPVKFEAHMNLNVNGRCPDCAGFKNIGYLTQMQIETAVNGGPPEKKKRTRRLPP